MDIYVSRKRLAAKKASSKMNWLKVGVAELNMTPQYVNYQDFKTLTLNY